MNKKINKKELIFSITYILAVIVLIFFITSEPKAINGYKGLQKNNTIDNSINDKELNFNEAFILEPFDLVKINDNEQKTSKIDTVNNTPQICNLKQTIDENYQKAMEISESTPLDFDTSKIIIEYCNKLELPPALVLAVIELESNFDQYAVGSSNDRGYLQIIPNTEKWLAESYGHLLGIEYNPDRIFETEYNIGLGMLYLHILKEAYGENYHKILSEYNRGYHNLKKYYSKNQTYATSYSRGVLSRKVKFKDLN